MSRKLLVAFAALGLLASAAATWVHYHLLVNPDYTSFCDVNATVSCKQAYLSRYGSLGGVPVAVGGLIFFTFVLLLMWAGRKGNKVADSAPAYIFAASTLALAVVLYLAYASFFVLKEVCPICVTTYVAVIGVFIVSGGMSAAPLSSLPGRAFRDMRVLVGTPLALVIALLFVGGAGSAIAYFPHLQPANVPTPAPIVALTADQRSEFEKWWEVQTRVQVPYSNDGAKVLVVKFNDYQCPPCKNTYYNYEPILSKYKPTDVKYLMKHYPLNPVCNASVPTLVHVAACDAAAAAVMAKSRETFDTLTAWFFAHQEELSPATVRSAAKEVGSITDFDAEYPKAIEEVKADAAVGGKLGVESTPTFFINGVKLKGGLPPQYFEAAIELELKRASTGTK